MKVKRLSELGITRATATVETSRDGRRFFSFTHGETGRGRWQVRFPLGNRDFPVGPEQTIIRRFNTGGGFGSIWKAELACGCETYTGEAEGLETAFCHDHCGTPPLDQEYALIDLKKTDPKGNGLFLLGAGGNENGDQLILWSLGPGFRGGASYEISGNARVISEGYEAEGEAGRMGGASCPVVLVTGPCRLTWSRSGRLYGASAELTAEFDGSDWYVGPSDECCLEQAVFADSEVG